MNNNEQNQSELFNNNYDQNIDIGYKNDYYNSYNEFEKNLKDGNNQLYYDGNNPPKKSKKFLIFFCIIIVVIFIIIYLLYRFKLQEITITGVTLDKTTISMEVDKTETIVATIEPSNATNKTLTWTSSDTSITTIKDGLVTAKAAGTATITATTANGKTATCVVNVIPPAPQEIVVTGVTLNKTTTSIEIGKTDTLVVAITPADATNKAITWSSSNIGVATIDANGIVTGKAAGTATITATTANGKTATCVVNVIPLAPQEIAVTGVTLNKTTTSIDMGSTETLSATISPSNATNKTVTWSSSNSTVATIDANGKITGKLGGTAVITAKTNNGKTATCTVKIKENCSLNLKEGENQSIAASNVENMNNYLQCVHRNEITSIQIPKGNYFFEVKSTPILINFSNITLDLNGSTFNVYKNGVGSYQLFKINNQDAGIVTLKNGTLLGDRTVHMCLDKEMECDKYGALKCDGGTHESGHGVAIYSVGVNIENLTIKNMMGDGIYINFPYNLAKEGSVNIQNNLIDSVRRNGISIIQGKNINIKSNIIRYTHGTWPQVGIDIERNNTSMFYENILIEGNTIYGNTGKRSIQLWAGIKGYMKIINNHLGDQIVGWDKATLNGSIGPDLERNLITINGNDTQIPSGEENCVEEANTVTSHINKKCFDQVVTEERCVKKNNTVNNVTQANRVEVILHNISTGKISGYTAICNFYKDNNKMYTRTMIVESDNKKEIENKLKQLFGFSGEVSIRKT